MIEKKNISRYTWVYASDEPQIKSLLENSERAVDETIDLGRGSVDVLRLDETRKVVRRHLLHGGLMRFLGDVFVGPSRVLKEFFFLIQARKRGAPVPKVLAAGTQRFWGLFYRGDLVTEQIPSQTLGQVLEKEDLQDLRPLLRLLLSLHRLGLDHKDLNVNNILIPHDQSAWVAIDFDGAQMHDVLPLDHRLKNLLRLDRSYEKQFGLQGPAPFLRRYRFWHHYLKNIGIAPRSVLLLLRAERWRRKWHRWWWSLTG